jgi:hypothetical protein
MFSIKELLPLKAGIVVFDLQEMFGAVCANEKLDTQINRQEKMCRLIMFL